MGINSNLMQVCRAEIKQKADKVNHMQNEKVTSLPNYRKFDDVPKFFEALCNKEMLSG
ncbi:unnamed protein product [Brassica oleracea]|uniref:Uncharacterized protein n=3 Tax=Brassica oleracea TaxID=3712 RepID=A0A0D3A8Q5_BRAOL|nr:unnamed protein product [Brassica oleracea]